MINTCIKEFQGEYRWLSNFYDCDIIINDIKYKSVEHAYQSMKTADINWKMVCSDFNNSAGKIKKYSKKQLFHFLIFYLFFVGLKIDIRSSKNPFYE